MNRKDRKDRINVICRKLDDINIIIEPIGYGKTYHELNRFIKSKLLKDKKDYENRIDKAIEELSYMSTDAYTDNYDIRDKYYNLLMNILKGEDENE